MSTSSEAQQSRVFSKSKLLSCQQCEKRLWLDIHRPQISDHSSQSQAAFAIGNTVGELARKLYDKRGKGSFVDIGGLGITEALKRTKQLVKERKPIFEAGFAAGGALAFADVLLPVRRKGEDAWRMVEVKSSGKVHDYQRDDAAIQAYIARKSGINLTEIAVASIDTSWEYQGAGNYDGLLVEHDLTTEAFARDKEVEALIAQAGAVAAKTKEPGLKTGKHCSDPFDCSYYSYCESQEPQPKHDARWFPRITAKPLKALIEVERIWEMKDIPDGLLNAKQLRVKEHTLKKSVYFDQVAASKALSPQKFPAWFLDFETITFAVPIWKGTRPYQKIPFQFSLHCLTKTGQLTHTEFLDVSGEDPTKKFAAALIEGIDPQGPIYVYNAAFETSVIKALAERLPKFKRSLMALVERVVDLLPVAQEHFYHPSQQGSWSIKSVLPAAVPELDYSSLAGVRDGGMAMDAFAEAIASGTSPERRLDLHRQLCEYCKLDTYAMVRLWQHFTGRHGWSL